MVSKINEINVGDTVEWIDEEIWPNKVGTRAKVLDIRRAASGNGNRILTVDLPVNQIIHTGYADFRWKKVEPKESNMGNKKLAVGDTVEFIGDGSNTPCMAKLIGKRAKVTRVGEFVNTDSDEPKLQSGWYASRWKVVDPSPKLKVGDTVEWIGKDCGVWETFKGTRAKVTGVGEYINTDHAEPYLRRGWFASHWRLVPEEKTDAEVAQRLKKAYEEFNAALKEARAREWRIGYQFEPKTLLSVRKFTSETLVDVKG